MKNIHLKSFFSVCIILVLVIAGVSQVQAIDLINGMAASLVLGQPDFVTTNPTVPPFPPLSASRMTQPRSIAVDPTTQKVFVADSGNNRVLRFTSLGALTNGAPAEAVLGQPNFVSSTYTTTQNGMWAPYSVAVDAAGNLYVAEFRNNRVLRFNGASGLPNNSPANAVFGQPDFTSNLANRGGSPTASSFWSPTGLAVAGGTLWVSDSDNCRVLRFDGLNNPSYDTTADFVLGQSGFTTNACVTTRTGMDYPVGLFADNGGRLWVVERGNNRLLRFDNALSLPNGAQASGVLGQPGYTTKTSLTTQSGFGFAFGVSGDSDGGIFVSQLNNHRISYFHNAATLPNGAPASHVLGQLDFTSGDPGLSASKFNRPAGLFFDPPTDTLWVADTDNHRVLNFGTFEFGLSSPSNGSLINDSTPLIQGTGRAGLTVNVWLWNTTTQQPIGVSPYCSGVVSAGIWSCTGSALTDGPVSINIIATDGTTTSEFQSSVTFTIDATPPAAPVILQPVAGTLTSDNSPVFSGTAEANSTVDVRVDGSSYCTAVASSVGGYWSCTGADLPDGVHQVRASATDLAGNTGPLCDPQTLTIDTTPPSAPTIASPAPGANFTNSIIPVNGGKQPNTSVNVQFSLGVDGPWTDYCAVANDSATTWNCQGTVPLPNGTIYLQVFLTDLVGLEGPAATRSFTIANPNPAPIIANPAPGVKISARRPTFNGTAAWGESVTISENSAVICTASINPDRSWSCSALADMPPGVHNVVAFAWQGEATSPPAQRSFEITGSIYLPIVFKNYPR